jgi:hypothetical protein
LLNLHRAGADAVGNQFAKLFLHQTLLHQVFEYGDGQLEPGLDFAGVGIHAGKSVAVEGGRHVHLDAVGAFLVADCNADALGLKLNFLLKDELVEDVPGVEAFQRLGYLVLTANLVELLAHLSHSDALVADFGEYVRGALGSVVALRHKVKQHAECDEGNYDAEKNSFASFLVLKYSSHSRCLLRW